MASIAAVLGVQAAQQALAEARDDEQRVVDPDAQADQQRQLRAERRHRDHVREQPDHRDAGAEREAGGDERQEHRRAASRRPGTGPTAAARKPKPVPPTPWRLASSIAWPPSSTRMSSFSADWATEITRFAALSGRSFACWSKVTVA